MQTHIPTKKLFLKLIKNRLSLIAIIIQIFILNAVKADEKLILDGINIGIYEKGPYVGFFTNINKNNQIEIGVNYLNMQIGKYDVGFSKDIKSNLSFKGVKLVYKKYLRHQTHINRPFVELGLELNKINAYSNIKLSEMKYTSGNLTVLCPSCSTLDLNIKPKPHIIPSASLGWQHKITSKINLRSSIGVQYKKINNANWNYNSNQSLPFFVVHNVDKAVNKVNKDLNRLPTLYPTFMLSIAYSFN
mgnify:CR=1 FL=1